MQMKKILLRAGMSPLLNYNPTRVIKRNLIHNNIGNMLFPSSISRALLCEDTIIDTVDTGRKYSSEHIRRINETYDCLVLPFANGFRHSFINQLNSVTNLINEVKIPCVVVGIGMQAKLDKDIDDYELDEAVSRFMKAVLKKSDKVGLRGEFTADYLKKLGFQEERDFTVIGCPSMYLYGKELPEMEVKELTPASNVSMNSKIQLPQKFHDFMYRCSKELPNHHYVPQVIEELSRMYMGKSYPSGFVKKIPEHFPVDFTHPVYQSGRGISFTNLPSWIEYLRGKDFSFGSRIHGNIVSILAGTPCFIAVSDKRIMELVDYHNIPHIMMKELKKDTSIVALHEKADFSAIRKGHEKRFMHYLDFLRKNGLQTIFDEDGNAPEISPFDRIIKEVRFAPPIKAFSALTPQEQLKRLREIERLNRRDERYFKGLSTGVIASIKDWKRCTLLREPNRNYEKQFPFIREYEAAVQKRGGKSMEDGDVDGDGT